MLSKEKQNKWEANSRQADAEQKGENHMPRNYFVDTDGFGGNGHYRTLETALHYLVHDQHMRVVFVTFDSETAKQIRDAFYPGGCVGYSRSLEQGRILYRW